MKHMLEVINFLLRVDEKIYEEKNYYRGDSKRRNLHIVYYLVQKICLL